MSTAPSAKRRRIEGDIITIMVGKDHIETLTVHESLLRGRGGFFDAALKKQWQEGQTRKIELPEDKPDSVAAYVEWLYSGRIEVVPSEAPTHLTKPEMNEPHLMLANLYVLAEKLGDDEACDAVMTEWVHLMVHMELKHGRRVLPGVRVIRTIYGGTPSLSPARQFLIHLWSRAGKAWFRNLEDNHGESLLAVPEFLLELLHEYATARPQRGDDFQAMLRSWLKKTTL